MKTKIEKISRFEMFWFTARAFLFSWPIPVNIFRVTQNLPLALGTEAVILFVLIGISVAVQLIHNIIDAMNKED